MMGKTHKKNQPTPSRPDEFGDDDRPVDQVDPDAIVAGEDERSRLEAEIEQWKAKYQRALADFQNFQRRARENEAEARRQSITSVLGSLLGVLDNFDHALQSGAAESSAEQLIKGVEMIKGQMLHALATHDVQRIEPAPGDEFDPHAHEAVQQVDSEDIEPGRIAALFQVGYRLGDRTLRPAKVMVAHAPASDQAPQDAPGQIADDGGSSAGDSPAEQE